MAIINLDHTIVPAHDKEESPLRPHHGPQVRHPRPLRTRMTPSPSTSLQPEGFEHHHSSTSPAIFDASARHRGPRLRQRLRAQDNQIKPRRPWLGRPQRPQPHSSPLGCYDKSEVSRLRTRCRRVEHYRTVSHWDRLVADVIVVRCFPPTP